jgi:hypothetical protein
MYPAGLFLFFYLHRLHFFELPERRKGLSGLFGIDITKRFAGKEEQTEKKGQQQADCKQKANDVPFIEWFTSGRGPVGRPFWLV